MLEFIHLQIRIEDFFEGFFSIRHFFHNLAYVSGERDRIFMKIFTTDVSLDKEVPVKFGGNPCPESVSGCRLRMMGSRSYSPWRTYAVSDCSCVDATRIANPRDCAEIYDSGKHSDGVYTVYSGSTQRPVAVYCDMTTDGGGWTVCIKLCCK